MIVDKGQQLGRLLALLRLTPGQQGADLGRDLERQGSRPDLESDPQRLIKKLKRLLALAQGVGGSAQVAQAVGDVIAVADLALNGEPLPQVLDRRGVIPAQDYQFLYDAGVVAIFGPGTRISQAGKDILEILLETQA